MNASTGKYAGGPSRRQLPFARRRHPSRRRGPGGQNDEWTEACRYMGPGILAATSKLTTSPETNGSDVTSKAIGASVKTDHEVASLTPPDRT